MEGRVLDLLKERNVVSVENSGKKIFYHVDFEVIACSITSMSDK